MAGASEEFTGIDWADYLVIAAYFIMVLIVGLIVSISKMYHVPHCLKVLIKKVIHFSLLGKAREILLEATFWLHVACTSYR